MSLQCREREPGMEGRLDGFLARAEQVLERLEPWLPAQPQQIDWQHCLAARWQREGRHGSLRALQVRLDLRLDDLLGVDRQRAQLEANTRQFVAGLPANHALLWGARGTGKSSLVRALLAAYGEAGLRLIEIERDDLADLPQVVAQLAGLPQRFVLFCDDLSFDAGEGDFRVLKSVLDGSLEQAPDNVLLYATSNRRHLVPERQSDNADWQRVDGELHPSEAVEDKIALSDRFGLWLSFYPSASRSTWPWCSTGSRHWPRPAGCAGRGARSWPGRRSAGPRVAATAMAAAPTSSPATGSGVPCSTRCRAEPGRPLRGT